MKTFFLSAALLLASLCAFAQSEPSNSHMVTSPDTNVNFRLFRAGDAWDFFKLDTRSGLVSYVSLGAFKKDSTKEYPVIAEPLAEGVDAKPGRFFLYPTESLYGYILLDQKDGRMWQIQWNSLKSGADVWEIAPAD